jgi:hypothetical protein
MAVMLSLPEVVERQEQVDQVDHSKQAVVQELPQLEATLH